jgi:uncharacterized protein HemX
MTGSSSGDYAPAHVPMVFMEPTQQTPPPQKAPVEEKGGLVISKGFLGAMVVLLLGAAIAGTGGFYWLWQGAKTDGANQVAAIQKTVTDLTKTNAQLIKDKTDLTTERDKFQQALIPYGEISRLQAATQAERQKIDDLLKVPSKVDYWKSHKAVDLTDPPIREPAERALQAKLDQLQKLSNDIGLWAPAAGPTAPAAGVIRPSAPPKP